MIKEVIKNVTVFFKGSLFLLGWIMFIFFSPLLVHEIQSIANEGGIDGIVYTGVETGDLRDIDSVNIERQLNVLKNGYMLFGIIGLIIISLLMINFFKDWDKEEGNN
jgi:FtsH-binding integral membrane protein